MNPPTQTNFTATTLPAPIHTLVHLGAGRCRELDRYVELDPQELLLVEADPQIAELLAGRFARLPQATVLQAAVAANASSATFHRYNVRDTSSLREPSGLFRLFPGLRLIDSFELRTLAVSDVLARVNPDAGCNNLLVIDVPGEELPILRALHEGGQIYAFRFLQLHCGLEGLYVGSEPAARVLEWLINAGYDVIEQQDSGDPERPLWLLRRNDVQLRNRELESQLAAITCERDGLARLIAERDADLAMQVRDVEEFTRRLATQAVEIETLAEQREQQARLASERRAVIERLEQEGQDLLQRLREAEARCDSLALAGDEQARLIEASEAQLDVVGTERDAQAGLIAARDDELKQVRAEAVEVVRRLADQAAQIEALVEERDRLARQTSEEQTRAKQLVVEGGELKRRLSEAEARCEGLAQARDEQVRLAGALQSQIAALEKERDDQAHWHQENASWAKSLKADKEILEGQLAAIRVELAESRRGNEALEAAARERLTQIDTLTRERDDRAHWCDENAKWATALEAEKKVLEGEVARLCVEVENANLSRQEQAELAAERGQQVDKLTAEIADLRTRQVLMNDEMARAEGQLVLIKDLLLQERPL